MIEIVSSRNALSAEDLRVLCIQEDWFTNGDNSQYEKLFDMNREGASLEELALVIWICSSDVSREEVLKKLTDRRSRNYTLDRYKRAIERIGGAEKLLNLPEDVKDILKETTDLETKTELLEAIAE